jgi:hypothetical protein
MRFALGANSQLPSARDAMGVRKILSRSVRADYAKTLSAELGTHHLKMVNANADLLLIF